MPIFGILVALDPVAVCAEKLETRKVGKNVFMKPGLSITAVPLTFRKSAAMSHPIPFLVVNLESPRVCEAAPDTGRAEGLEGLLAVLPSNPSSPFTSPSALFGLPLGVPEFVALPVEAQLVLMSRRPSPMVRAAVRLFVIHTKQCRTNERVMSKCQRIRLARPSGPSGSLFSRNVPTSEVRLRRPARVTTAARTGHSVGSGECRAGGVRQPATG